MSASKESVFEINHSKFGTEEFHIVSAKYNIYRVADNIWEFVVSFKTDKSLLRTKELEKLLDAKPNFEAAVLLSSGDIELKEGKSIFQKEGYDYERDENLSNIYYFEHNSVEELSIDIIELSKEWIALNINGKAIIVGSNGVNPDANLKIVNTKFYLDNNLFRSFS
ncbi:MAG TPA: hypothetical protein PKY59_21085 [Pyrinomonadaceae bacterium]|nr:hypothetical protein [Pyrinomonadaceae bacterium]